MTPDSILPQALFLDAAGTLFELQEPVGLTYARFAAAHGVSVDATSIERAFRAAWRELPPPLHPEGCPAADDDRSWWRQIVRRSFEDAAGVMMDAGRLDALFAAIYAHFALPQAWRLYPDVLPALHALNEQLRLFVVSNFDRRLHGILDGLGIADFFEGVIVSSEVGASKPHPRIFRSALRAAGVSPAGCLHVGDEEKADRLGAEQVGIPAIHLVRPEMSLLDVVDKVRCGDISRLRSRGK